MKHFPTVIELELSNRCNLDCIMCPRLPQTLNMGDMSEALLHRVLGEALDVPGRIFRLHGIGEPLLSPLFRPAVERIKSDPGDHRIELLTNGHLLSRDMVRFLVRQEVDDVTISVAAATAESYLEVRRSKKFDRVVRNTVRLIDERDRTGADMRISVQLVRVPPADQEVDAFVDFWSRFDVVIEIWHDMNWGRRAFGAPATLDLEPCQHLWRHSVVCWDGRVGICCVDSARMHVVGNANQSSLREVYNGPEIEALRDIHRRRETYKMPICVDCSYRDDRHIAFLSNVSRTGERPGAFLPVPETAYGAAGPNSTSPLVQLPRREA
ncbi:MAG: radical SAM protein [Myxococcota bacterium]